MSTWLITASEDEKSVKDVKLKSGQLVLSWSLLTELRR